MTVPNPPPEPRTAVLEIGGPIAPADFAGLCARGRTALRGDGAARLACDVAAVRRPDAATIDCLARLALVARREGATFTLLRPTPALRELVALVGLCDVLGVSPPSGLQDGREPEQREEGGGVEEHREPDDAAVPHIQHLQRPWLVPPARPARPVLPEGG